MVTFLGHAGDRGCGGGLVDAMTATSTHLFVDTAVSPKMNGWYGRGLDATHWGLGPADICAGKFERIKGLAVHQFWDVRRHLCV